MGRRAPWFEDDQFWKMYERAMFPQQRIDAAREQAGQLVARLGLKPGQAVLDLCCGPGRFSLELARRGYRVTGVDRTRSYLAEARRAARREKLEVEFVQEDMRRFMRPRAFDAVINVFPSFGYFRRQSDDLRVCRNVHRSMQPGGRFLIETLGKEGLARRYQCRDWQEVGGELVLHEVVPVDGWSALEQRRILVRKGRTYEFRLWMRLYSAAELRGLLERAGFRSVRMYGGYDGSPYDSEARRLVVVGRK
ncbi:methyltransferase domain-containing protein [candidate division WOR-3 bacterium]|uniref:Methyltransferase domain-containing protein n=1 Tax=candidate division WOR-3 bacterium TaxID=2052148 RepID=A0A937XGR7_UNCW3|nr:methyltransferase domain-containing protein [candidate division WOR-3 bacterium]